SQPAPEGVLEPAPLHRFPAPAVVVAREDGRRRVAQMLRQDRCGFLEFLLLRGLREIAGDDDVVRAVVDEVVEHPPQDLDGVLADPREPDRLLPGGVVLGPGDVEIGDVGEEHRVSLPGVSPGRGAEGRLHDTGPLAPEPDRHAGQAGRTGGATRRPRTVHNRRAALCKTGRSGPPEVEADPRLAAIGVGGAALRAQAPAALQVLREADALPPWAVDGEAALSG